MSKLYFRYGTVNCAKSLNLLAVAYNYDNTGSDILVMKPKIDDRWGADKVVTRAGLEREVNHIIGNAKDLRDFINVTNYQLTIKNTSFI